MPRIRIYTDEERHIRKIAANKRYRNSEKGAEKHRQYSRIWRSANCTRVNAWNMKRHAAKLMATPKWLTNKHFVEMEMFYKNRPSGYEVDHIIPLQGEAVRGFHVPWNLQYLTKEQNRKKKNKMVNFV